MKILLVLAGVIAALVAAGLVVSLGLIVKRKGWKSVLVPGIAVVVLLGGLWIYYSIKSEKPSAEARVAVEEFQLKVAEETPTVEASPGTYHRLWANKPYQAISVQMDGSRKLYNMPAGWESWTGAAPAGRLRLIAKKEGTMVKIWSRK